MTHLDDAKHIIALLEAHGFSVKGYTVSEAVYDEESEFSLDLTIDASERDDDSPTSISSKLDRINHAHDGSYRTVPGRTGDDVVFVDDTTLDINDTVLDDIADDPVQVGTGRDDSDDE